MLKLGVAIVGLAIALVLVIALVGVSNVAHWDDPGATGSARHASRSGLRLLVADAPAPFLLDVNRGSVTPVVGLPTKGERGVVVLPVGEHALVLSSRVCGRCRRMSAYVVRRGGTEAVLLAKALQVVPSRDGQSVWMLDGGRRSRCTLREVGLDGDPRQRGRTIGCSTVVVAELPAGLLVSLAGRHGPNAHDALLERDGDVVRLGDSGAQPVVGNILLSGSDRHTPLVVRDAHTGTSRRLARPARPGYSLGQVTGEPNGPLAIVEFAKFSPVHKTDMWLLDTQTWRWEHLPGMPARLVPKVTDVEWAADGRVVILSGGVLGIWRPGGSRIAFRDVKAPEQPGSEFVPW